MTNDTPEITPMSGQVDCLVQLSVLVAGLMKRLPQFGTKLAEEFHRQVAMRNEVEVLMFLDAQTMSTGLKRRHLLNAARGRYFAFFDDDDWPEPDYIDSILTAIREHPGVDVITYDVEFSENGEHRFIRKFWIDGPWPAGDIGPGLTGDKPSHTMCWRRDLVKDIEFPNRYHGEDVKWVVEARKRLVTEHRLDRVLYHYRSRPANREHADRQIEMDSRAPHYGLKPRTDGREHKIPGVVRPANAPEDPDWL